MAPKQGRFYKIKLSTGRILGPLDLERIRALILKNQVTGSETAREYPQGDWKDINSIPEIADLIVSRASGALDKESPPPERSVNFGTTRVLPPEPPESSASPPPAETPALGGTQLSRSVPELQTQIPMAAAASADVVVEERTVLAPVGPTPEVSGSDEEERTRVVAEPYYPSALAGLPMEAPEIEFSIEVPQRNIATEKTVVFQRPAVESPKPSAGSSRNILKTIAAFAALGLMAWELLGTDESQIPYKFEPIRPSLPAYIQGKSDPNQSAKLYAQGMSLYVQDTVQGYRQAAGKFRGAAAYDVTNVKALAMLASTYLNLIDSSNKDENYFSVLSKLIDMSRAKAADLPETVIADVEFFVTINKAEAAQNRIIEYTKTHQTFGMEMFYYLALAFYSRGDAQAAARYLGQYPDNKAFSAKIFYLRGLVAEKLGDNDTALREYIKGVQFNHKHAKSRLRVADLLNHQGRLKEASAHLEYLTNNPGLLAPKDQALAYFIHAQLAELYQNWNLALGDMERATRLDKENHDYLLELYTLRAKAGDSIQSVQKQARMYYFLGEGEKLLKLGRYQEALTQFLQARQANDTAPLPLVKIGDMFTYLHDLGNARVNYKMAADRAPNSIEVWSKYMDVLIQSYEWDEAKKAMDRFRLLPVSQSAIDKAAADMYAKMGKHAEAQMYYKKAMSRDSVDPEVYSAYARSLTATKNFKDAPFFFALALRYDPLNIEALSGTAKCIAATESIDRAIGMLQDELIKNTGAKAELLSAIAEFQIQKGDWDQAQQNVEQAMAANPDYGAPWKLQAQIYMNREGVQRDAVDKALAAYQSFSERNASDPTGYLERYRLFIKKTEYEKAAEELRKIFGVYPKYPNLHYYFGALYAIMGNHKTAFEEFKTEVGNNPSNVTAQISAGKELIQLSDPADSLAFLNKAMQLAPQSAEAKQEAAYANYLLKNYPAAIALFQAALVFDQGNPIIYRRMGQAYLEMGDGPNAAYALRKYLEMEPDASDKGEILRILQGR